MTELATLIPEDFQLIRQDNAAVLSLTSNAEFLPRLQCCGGNSDLAKEGKIPMGNLALVYNKDRAVDLGKEVDALLISYRAKAMRLLDGQPMEYYDKDSEVFKKVMSDSETPDSGCMFGVEFLIWLPDSNVLCTHHMGSASGRREATALIDIMNKTGQPRIAPATLGVKFIKTKKFSWHTMTATACNTAFGTAPDRAELMKVLSKFNNPKDSVEVEKAPTDNRAR